jgi:two-component system chemotaxis response regulator CheB
LKLSKMSNKLKILVVDDTIFYRKLLSNLMEEMPDIDLMGAASNGMIALKKIELSPPDLVLLDVVMPKMDGLEVLKRIKTNHPGVDVVMVSGADLHTAGLTVKALEAGALDFVSKPRAETQDASIKGLRAALTPIIALAKTMKYSRDAKNISKSPTKKIPDSPVILKDKQEPVKKNVAPTERKTGVPKIDVVAIGVSTGGPNALKILIPQISKNLPVPILTVQHMPPVFTASLAESLDKISDIQVVEAKIDQPINNGTMYIAPGGRHMVVRKGPDNVIKLSLVDSPPAHNCRPAADVLFRSIGMAFGANVLTVILTGMGKDGASGVAAIRRKGGYSIVQDEKTSVVWGMPGTIAEAGDADEILPLNKIAQRIMEIAQKGRI